MTVTTIRTSVIDADAHVTEPRDLFTSRVSAKFGDMVPHVLFDAATDEDGWYIGDVKIAPAWGNAASGFEKNFPPYPRHEHEAHPAAMRAVDRAKYLDAAGIDAQVLYPNVAGFGGQRFLQLKDPDLMLACVRAYNDFLVEWAADAPGRFVPIAALPFWDVEQAVAEAQRAVEIGHRGVLFSGAPHELGFPILGARHWDPLWNALQDLDIPVSFHLGSGDIRKSFARGLDESRASIICRVPNDLFLNIGRQLNDLLFSGVLPRFPALKFVMVESGIGYIPFLLNSADYHFDKSPLRDEWPWYTLRPSEYFRRQCSATFWFEDITADLIDSIGPENVLFETDYPHQTSLREGEAVTTIDHIQSTLSPDVAAKVLHGNSARLYHL